MVDCSTPMNNMTYCDLSTGGKMLYDLNSYTPIGIKLWTLLAIGIGIILIYCLILYQFGFMRNSSEVRK